MKCASCGAELVPGAKFCDACGTPVVETKVAQVAEEPTFVKQYPSVPPAEPPAPTPVVGEVLNTSPASSGQKILGIDASQFGLVTLILGIAGLLLSCIGCGGLISILGIVAGVMGLKNSAVNRQMTIIGLVLSGLGVIVTLVAACIFIFYLSSANSSGYYY